MAMYNNEKMFHRNRDKNICEKQRKQDFVMSIIMSPGG